MLVPMLYKFDDAKVFAILSRVAVRNKAQSPAIFLLMPTPRCIQRVIGAFCRVALYMLLRAPAA